MRLFVSISYDGSSFSGWQIQRNAPSVQGELERALSIAFGVKTDVTGAGRTDAGVNAVNYIAHFDLPDGHGLPADETVRKINAILPPSVVVNEFFRVGDEAHARFDATLRTYKYFIHTCKDPFAVRSLFFRFPLDVPKMNEAALCLLGEHDFSCFEKTGGSAATSICTVTEARWEALDDSHFVFTVSANRFLRNMVRAIVGTLLEVGGGKHSPGWVNEVLASGDRGMAGQSVPGEPLYLAEIKYPYELVKI